MLSGADTSVSLRKHTNVLSNRLSAHPLTICVLFAFRQWPWSIASRAEEMPRERHPASRSHVLAHLGLVAGMVAARGLGASMDRATQQHPAMPIVTPGTAVQAMGRHGLGCIHPPRSLVPPWCQHTPPARLLAPPITAKPLKEDPLGRAVAPRSAEGVTALSRRMAAPAAPRLGRAPPLAPLDRPSGHGDGRAHSAEAPDAPGRPLPRGSRREHRPALHPGRRAWSGEHQAGLPLLLPPLNGQSSEAQACGQVRTEPRAPWQTPSGLPSLVAASALERHDNLQQGAETRRQGSPRVPA